MKYDNKAIKQEGFTVTSHIPSVVLISAAGKQRSRKNNNKINKNSMALT